MPESNKKQTIEQQRAAHALQKIPTIKNTKEFVALANGLPTMIHTNGLGQAIAFCKGKKEEHYRQIIEMLAEWLCSDGRPFNNTQPDNILETITQKDMQTYMRAQAEAMAYLLWVKKFAKALDGAG